jgi:hypothetical protein
MVCTGACLCLGTMLDFLRFTNVDPQSSDSALLDRRRSQHLEWNAMHNLKGERR